MEEGLEHDLCCGRLPVQNSVTATSSLGKVEKENNIVEMEPNGDGIYESTLRVGLRKKTDKNRRLGPTATFNKECNNSTVKELIVYSHVRR